MFKYLYNLRNRGSSFGIERMERLAYLLGNPQNSFPVIHVAGTNGKGSVCSMLDSVYRENGYKVGLFTSPHLVYLGERIKVDGKNISESEILEKTAILKPIAEKMERENQGSHPSFFEFMTAISFLYFKEQNIDLAVIETGLGGRLDSTNVVNPNLSVITTISLDHCEILGDRLEDIAKEKAGIIKQGKPVLTGWLPKCTRGIFEEFARELKSPLNTVEDWPEKKWPNTNLQGAYQKRNAALALRATEILSDDLPVRNELVQRGLNKVFIPGRWQEINGDVNLILDTCHNSAGAECLKDNLLSFGRKPIIWVGVLGKDRAKDIMKVVTQFASEIFLFEVEQPRACSVKYLKSLIPNDFFGKIVDFDLVQAKEFLLNSKSKETVLVTGSIYLIGDILSLYSSRTGNKKLNWSDIL